MSYIKSTIILICLIVFLGCNQRKPVQNHIKSPAEPRTEVSGSFTVSGAYALNPMVRKWSDDFMKMHPSVRVVVASGGTGQGIADLQGNKSQLAMISRPLTDEEYGAGIWTLPVAKDGVAVIMNQKNPYFKRILNQGLSPDELLRVFTSDKPVTWGELLDTIGKEKVAVFKRLEESGASDVFANFLNKESTDLKGTMVISDEEMIKSVQDNPLAIGFSNFSYAFDITTGERRKDIQIIPADLDYDNKIDTKEIPFSNLDKAHRGLWLGLYPKNLCRELLIGSEGKPSDPAIIEFLKYILTEGQNEIKTFGLCKLNDVYVSYALDKLK
jgi:phosphate transport system substrate-binding protein